MNTTSIRAARGTTRDTPTLILSELLRRTALDAAGNSVGRLSDVIAELRSEDHPRVTGLVATIGRHDLFIPADQILAWHTERLELADFRLDLRPFRRRDGEVLLRRDILGHRVVDVPFAALATAHDVLLSHLHGGWQVTALDVRPRRVLRRAAAHDWRDWRDVEPLIGCEPERPGALGRLRGLRPADLADLIEGARPAEQVDLLNRVRVHPQLEAVVFEELDDDETGDILQARTERDIADLLARMRVDDAVDTLMELPHDRRNAVLDLMPASARARLVALLGYAPGTAGGLMAVDHLSVPDTVTVATCLEAVRAARAVQSESLEVVFLHDPDLRLTGAATLVSLVQAEPDAPAIGIADPAPVHVHPEAGLDEVVRTTVDYHLLVLPVLDGDDRILGVITVDDVLEAAVGPERRHRRA